MPNRIHQRAPWLALAPLLLLSACSSTPEPPTGEEVTPALQAAVRLRDNRPHAIANVNVGTCGPMKDHPAALVCTSTWTDGSAPVTAQVIYMKRRTGAWGVMVQRSAQR